MHNTHVHTHMTHAQHTRAHTHTHTHTHAHTHTRTHTKTHNSLKLFFCTYFLVPQTSVHNLQPTAVNASNISLNWSVNHPRKINGPLREFVINYYPIVNGVVNSSEARTLEMVSLKDFIINYEPLLYIFNAVQFMFL